MRKIKKILKTKIIIGSFFVCCFTGILSGCDTRSEKEVSIRTLAEELKTKIHYDGELSQIDKETAIDIYNLGEINIADCVVYMSKGATAEEIAIFSTKNEVDSSKVEEALEYRVMEQKQSNQNFEPKDLKKLDEAVIEEEGNTVILCVSNENEKAEEIIDSMYQ